MNADICVIGGGAAGLAAAITAARRGVSVVIAEKNPRVGKKILSTGNGRCNLSHLMPTVDAYHGDGGFINNILQELGSTGTFGFFKSLGVLLRSDYEGRVYPYSNSANTVLDALRREIERINVRIVADCAVTAITGSDGGFSVVGSERIEAKKVIIATGGKAAPASGSDGSGYLLLKSLGVDITPLKPALTALKCNVQKSLKGIRAKASVLLRRDGQAIAVADGEVQFTEFGLSGICVFDVSVFACEGDTISVNLLPDYSPEDAIELLKELDGGRGLDAVELLSGLMNRRLAETVVAKADGEDYASLAASAASLCYTVSGCMPYANAQVTAGGVPSYEVEDDLRLKKRRGIYVVGELLDVDGICGGYNLHWAWCSGIRAGNAAAKAVGK